MQSRLFIPAATHAPLAGCGFELRRAPDFAFTTIAMPADGGVATELRRTLTSGGNVRVVPADAKPDAAQVVLDIVSNTQEKVVVGINASGQVREFQLRS